MWKSLYAAALIPSLLTISTAYAADLPVWPTAQPTPAPLYVPPPFNWSGLYIGANAGAGWSQENISDSFFGLNFGNPMNNPMFIGGGAVGGNYQISHFVFGVEGDIEATANQGTSGPGVAVAGTTIRVSASNRWIATLAGRFGYAFDRVLIYGKGGGSWVGNGNFTITNVPTGVSAALSNSSVNTGWLAGAGVEGAFADNWTVKVEYDFIGLSNQFFTVPATFPVAALGADTFSTNRRGIHMFTVGINYLTNPF
jgi:outer membrane immunogenic protein